MTRVVVGHFPVWEAPSGHCSGGPTAGAMALMRWFVEQYHDKGGYNLGIYNCRDVRGASTPSVHGEGRAADLGFPVGDPDGNALLTRLLPNVGKLGIQAIIYERIIYSAKSPAGRPYTGTDPHLTHLHVELTRESAARLTYATVAQVMAGGVIKAGSRTLGIGCRGADVSWLQRRLNLRPVDGIYGPATKRAVLRWERAQSKAHPHLVVDGVTGGLTWQLLGVHPSY